MKINSKSVTNFPSGLYAITDPQLLPSETLLPAVESALKGGARTIQYRDKPASSIERLTNAQNLRDLCSYYNARFIINDDIELCLRIKADGVHLGKTDGDIIEARSKLGVDKILGVTCHNDLIYAQNCIEQGVDYCAFGRLFPSKTKANAPQCSIEVLKQAAKLPCPTVAIGGITIKNIRSLINTKTNSIAVIHGLFGQTDIEATAKIFSSFFKQSTTI